MENKRENEKQKVNRTQQEIAGCQMTDRMQRESVRQQIVYRMQQNYRMWEQMGYGRICETSMEKIAKAASEGLMESLKKRDDKQQILDAPKRLERYLQNYEAACQCYYLYRNLHERTDNDTKTAVLLGDYFFGEFSHYLIPIDSPKLIEIFSGQLQKETGRAGSENGPFQNDRPEEEAGGPSAYRNLEEYAAFVKRIPERFVEELV